MRPEFLLLFLLVGTGNYLMRFLPLLWTLRRRDAESVDEVNGEPGGLLSLVGPSVVAALLVTSVLSGAGNGAGLVRTGITLLLTVIVAVRSGNLGLTVLVGVAAYWMVSLVV